MRDDYHKVECPVCGGSGYVDLSLGAVWPPVTEHCDCVLDPVKKVIMQQLCRADVARKADPYGALLIVLQYLKNAGLFANVYASYTWDTLHINYSLPGPITDGYNMKIAVEDLTREMSIVMDVMYD